MGVDLLTLVGFGGYKLGKKFDIFGKGNVKGRNPFGNKDVIIEEEDNNVLGNLNIGMQPKMKWKGFKTQSARKL